MRSIVDLCSRQIRSLQRRVGLQCLDRRGTVALSFAVAAMPIALGVAAAVDFAGITAGRAALQRAADNAAVSGAAAYIAYTGSDDALNAVAISTAASAFCNAATALPGGFTITAPANSKPCGAAQGPTVSAAIAGYQTGTPGIASGSGCTASKTVVPGYTCGFAVTVTATATTNTTFAGLLGASHTLSVTATAVNPFIDLNRALSATLKAYAYNVNSIWIYPLLLNSEGQPDFSTNSGALPDFSECTGDPDQTWCGTYRMIASTRYASCTSTNPCTTNGPCPSASTCPSDKPFFGGSGGIVQNNPPSAAITATTPLGVAFQSAAGAYQSIVGYNKYGYYNNRPSNNCYWPTTLAYTTVPQAYDANNKPLIVFPKKDSQGNIVKDSSGNVVNKWVYPTHWFYSSYLSNNAPPSQQVIDIQNDTRINPDTNKMYRRQIIPSVPQVANGMNSPSDCPNPTSSANAENLVTTYPTGLNCSLYIAKDPGSLTPNPSYAQNKQCFSPASTPGQQYATLSCQNYGKSNYVLFWNDMSGNNDDMDYGNGTLSVNCSAVAKILLIN